MTSKKLTVRELAKAKEKIGTKRRFIVNYSEIGWVAEKANYKSKEVKGDLIENYKKLSKGLRQIEKFEDLINSYFKSDSCRSDQLKKHAPQVWKLKRFINDWKEENKQELVKKFADKANTPEEYKKDVETFKKEREEQVRRSKEFWTKRTIELTAEREIRRIKREEDKYRLQRS